MAILPFSLFLMMYTEMFTLEIGQITFLDLED